MANSYRFMTPMEMVSPSGRLSRTQYLLHLTVYGAVLTALTLIVLFFYIPGVYSGPLTAVKFIASFLVAGLTIVFMVCLSAKRAHDLGMPAIVVTPLFISFPFAVAGHVFPEAPEALGFVVKAASEITKAAQIGMGFYFLLAPGEKGANRYGPDPLAD